MQSRDYESTVQADDNQVGDEPEIMVLPNNPDLVGEVGYTPNIHYRPDKDVSMDVVVPMGASQKGAHLPAVLFIQGSGWTTPNRLYAIPRLLQLVNRGFAVISVGHTDSCNGSHPFPEFLLDVKSALRYVRLHSNQLYVDPGRIGAWGTSSGGNTALLLGMTQGDPRYEDSTNPGAPDVVNFVVSCFGVAHLEGMLTGENPQLARAVCGLSEEGSLVTEVALKRAHDMSPLRILNEGTSCPPTLLLHGDSDNLVPYSQTYNLYKRMLSLGKDVSMVRVKGADHEGDFWSHAVTDAIIEFIVRQSKLVF